MTADLHDFALQCAPGRGYVGRTADVCFAIVPTGDHQRPITDALLALLALTRDGDASGRRLLRRVVAIIADAEPDDVPSLALVCPVDDDLVVLLQGDFVAAAKGPSADVQFSSESVVSWTERRIKLPIERLDVTLASAGPVDIEVAFDLRDGLVPGAGFRLSSSTDVEAIAPAPQARVDAPHAPSPPPPPPVAPDEGLAEPTAQAPVVDAEPLPAVAEEKGVDYQTFSLHGVTPDDEREPLPFAGGDAHAGHDHAPGEDHEHPAPDDPVLVSGVACSRGHFNNPESLYCSLCGIGLLQLTRVPIDGIRPPLGYLVLDDGATYILDRDYVVGREPERDELVIVGNASPLALPSGDAQVSRCHARVLLDGWSVTVIDLRSANGTYISTPTVSTWTRVSHETPLPLDHGDRIKVGTRTFVFESHHKG